ncbi:MAG: class I SAM-dependent DNA methyltransferase [Nitrososphaerales archaeon]
MSEKKLSFADILEAHLARVPVHRALIRVLEHRLFAEQFIVKPVLDIGCGDGHYAAAAFPGGLDSGIDITREIVSEAAQHGPYRSLAVADGTRLPAADGSFQTVVSNCVIEHIPDIESLVGEVNRVLKPGGRFIFSVPGERFTESLFTVRTLNGLGLKGLAQRYGTWWNGNASHCTLESPKQWQARLERHGLQLDDYEYYMSLDAARVFELSHYYAVPSIAWHKLTGKWSLRPGSVRNSPAFRWLLPCASEPMPAMGACIFFVASKG